MNNSPAKDNEWFTYEIIVKGNDIKILINGKPVDRMDAAGRLEGHEGSARAKARQRHVRTAGT